MKIENPLEEQLESKFGRILGMDEAGRGPAAGPLCVAGIIFEKGYRNDEINDSKKLSEKKRERLYYEIIKDALWYRIVLVSEESIDSLNIYRACQKAMEEIAGLANADYILTDAMKLHEFENYESVIKGDSKSLSIAAASILAKVTRDRYMKQLDRLYPEYGYASHKGYPTKKHLEALEKYGVPPCSRKSWKPVKNLLEKESEIKLF